MIENIVLSAEIRVIGEIALFLRNLLTRQEKILITNYQQDVDMSGDF